MNKVEGKLWFKRRRYGWGWTPVTWQGWLCIALFVAVVLSSAFTLPMKPNEPTSDQILMFVMYVAGASLILLAISFMKGPNPKFRWGKKSTDNPDEDI